MVMLSVTHTPGRHCASTGLGDLLAYHGQPLSEPFCLGLGAGLGLWYLNDPALPASRMIHVRSADLETQFFRRLKIPFQWEQFNTPEESQQALCARLDQGRPAIILTDIYYLPYYNSRTHFPGHLIAVWGYDPETGEFFVTDTEREHLQSVPFRDLAAARFSGGGIFPLAGNQFAPSGLSLPDDLAPIIVTAIVDNSRTLLDDRFPEQGIRALATWQRELKQWQQFPDRQWTARLAYQVIEKRGSGGGGFRKIYSEFLEEAAGVVPAIVSCQLVERMRKCADAWTALADALKNASENTAPDFREIAACLEKVQKAEYTYHQAALRLHHD